MKIGAIGSGAWVAAYYSAIQKNPVTPKTSHLFNKVLPTQADAVKITISAEAKALHLAMREKVGGHKE